MRWGGLTSLAVAGLLALAACSNQIEGRPSSGDEATGTRSAPSSGSDPGAVDLADQDPCELVTDSVAASIGTGRAERGRDLPSSTGCTWKVDKGSLANSYTLAVSIFPKLGTDRINSSWEKTATTVNFRPAVEYSAANDNVCVVALEVSSTSRIEVSTTRAGSKASEVCPEARAAAELIEPELPSFR